MWERLGFILRPMLVSMCFLLKIVGNWVPHFSEHEQKFFKGCKNLGFIFALGSPLLLLTCNKLRGETVNSSIKCIWLGVILIIYVIQHNHHWREIWVHITNGRTWATCLSPAQNRAFNPAKALNRWRKEPWVSAATSIGQISSRGSMAVTKRFMKASYLGKACKGKGRETTQFRLISRASPSTDKCFVLHHMTVTCSTLLTPLPPGSALPKYLGIL